MEQGRALEEKVSTLLNWVDPQQTIARMATASEDRLHATDMWIHNHPVQLTTIKDRIKLHSKAVVAFQSMPKTGASRWVVSAPPHVSTETLLQVIKKIANDKNTEDRVITLH